MLIAPSLLVASGFSARASYKIPSLVRWLRCSSSKMLTYPSTLRVFSSSRLAFEQNPWIFQKARYIQFFGGKTHPRKLDAKHIEKFLSHLATKGNVAASTQHQALNALVFLYRDVLNQPLDARSPLSVQNENRALQLSWLKRKFSRRSGW